MKKLISIIVFLLFFMTSFHSYALSEPMPPPSCSSFLSQLQGVEESMIHLYIQIGKKNNDLVKNLEIIKNDDNLIVWPIISQEINARLESTLKLPLSKGVDDNDQIFFTKKQKHNAEMEELENFFDRFIWPFKNNSDIFETYEMKDIFETYETFRFVIRELQLIVQSFPKCDYSPSIFINQFIVKPSKIELFIKNY